MKKNIKFKSEIDTSYVIREGESIEEKLRRIAITKEPIDCEQSPEIYQERAAGVDPLCDIRTDRMQLAQDSFDTFRKTYMAARANRANFGTPEEGMTIVVDEDGNITQQPLQQ